MPSKPRKPSIRISVIIVNYQADEYVRKLQKSFLQRDDIECIVIDNSSGERGYGAGCNLGAEQAKGEYLFFTNPDVYCTASVVDSLADFLLTHPQVGLVGPQIRNEHGAIDTTCSTVPTAWQAAVVYSWLGTLPLFADQVKQYRLWGFNHQSSRPVPSVSGACFMMRADEFRALGGFDEQFFLYFEEFDLAKRIKEILEMEVYYLATISVIHYGQHSTNQTSTAPIIFRQSRRRWLEKYYGWKGILANTWIRIWEK